MNEAVDAQSAAAARSVRESYRAQLRLVRSRVEAHWREEAAAVTGNGDPQQRFAELTRDGADGAILFSDDDTVAFPQPVRGGQIAALEDPLQLSLEVLSTGQPPREPGTFHPTAVRDVCAFTSNDRRTLTLYRTKKIKECVIDLLTQ